MKTSIGLILLAILAGPAAAENARILLPVAVVVPLPGANGSLWKTEIVAHNNGANTASFFFPEPCELTLCLEPYLSIAPNETKTVLTNSPRGSIVVMPADQAKAVTFGLRVRDLSRQAETWGTEIPVVAESGAFVSTAEFLNVPASSDFRVLLRIYDFTDIDGRQFNVKVFPVNGPTPLLETVATTMKVPGQGIAEAELPNLVPTIATSSLRFEVIPTSPGPFWAFVSVTNNATQHVTLITQQP